MNVSPHGLLAQQVDIVSGLLAPLHQGMLFAVGQKRGHWISLLAVCPVYLGS